MSEASIILSAVDRTKEAFASVRGNLDGMHASVNTLQGALLGLGSSLGVLAFANMTRNVIESAAAMHDLTIMTGTSTEALSGLASIGKLSETSAQDIGAAMNKLAKNMASVTEDGKGAAAALRAIGIDFNSFARLSPDEKMQKLAVVLDQFQDGSGKSAVAMALLGKEGARLLPFMKDLAVAGDLQAKMTSEQSARADELSDNFIRLRASSEAWKKELVMGMLPALADGSQALTDVITRSGGVRDEIRKLAKDGSIAEWTRTSIIGLSYLMDAFAGIVRVVKTVGLTTGAVMADTVSIFGGLANGLDKALRGDFRGAVDSVKGIFREINAHGEAFKRDFDDLWTENTLGQMVRARMQELQDAAGSSWGGEGRRQDKPGVNFGAQAQAQGAGTASSGKNPFDQVLKSIEERTAIFNAQIEAGRELTESEKLLVRITAEVAAGRLDLNEAELELLDTKMIALFASEKAAKQHDAERKAAIEASKAYENEIQRLASGTSKIEEEITQQRDRTAALLQGKDATAELTAARLEEQAAALESQAIWERDIDASGRLADAMLLQAARLRELAGERRRGSAIEAGVNGFKEVWQSVDRTAHDVFVNIFEGGKTAFTKLRDVLKSTLLDLLYQMTLKQWLIPITAALTGTTAGIAQAATGSAVGGGLLGAAGGALGGLGLFGSGVASGLTAWGSGGSVMGVLGSAMNGSLFAGGIANGVGVLAGALGPIALGIGALVALLGKKGGGPKVEGSTGNILSDIVRPGVPLDAEANAKLSDLTKGLEAQFAAITSGIAGVDPARFGAAVSSDPKGTAPSFFELSATANGQTLASFVTREAPRDNAQLQALITQQTTSVLYQALKNSSLPESLAKLLGDETQLEGMQSAIERVTAARQKELQTIQRVAAAQERARGFARDFLGGDEYRNFLATTIQQRLSQGGISVNMGEIFGATTETVRNLWSAVNSAGNADAMEAVLDVVDAFKELRSGASGAADKVQDLGSVIRTYIDDLTITRAGTASPEALFTGTQGSYLATLTRARMNEESALSQITNSAQRYIEAAMAYNGSGSALQGIIDQVRAELSGLPVLGGGGIAASTITPAQLGATSSTSGVTVQAGSSTGSSETAVLVAEVRRLQDLVGKQSDRIEQLMTQQMVQTSAVAEAEIPIHERTAKAAESLAAAQAAAALAPRRLET